MAVLTERKKMRRKPTFKYAVAVILAALFLAMAGCGPDPYFIRVEFIEGVPETGVVGTPLTLTGKVRPVFASNKNIVWSVKDAGTTGAGISGNKLTVNAKGTVTIRAKIANGFAEGKEYVQDFKVVFTALKVLTGIAVKTQPSRLAYAEGEALDLSGLAVTLSFDDASAEDVGFVQFASKGITTSPAQGTPLALAHNGQPVTVSAGAYSASTNNLTVNEAMITVPVTGVTLNPLTLSLIAGNTAILTAEVTPDNATNPAVTWSSGNTNVATVSDGVVTAHAAGTAVITVTTVDGNKTATCAVTVQAAAVPVTGVTLNHSALTLTAGNTTVLTAEVTPDNATNKNVTWSSGNTNVATVSDGVVTAHAPGTVVITVTTVDGNKTATCVVTVQAASVPVTGVTLNHSTLTLIIGNTEILTATVTPSNATNPAVTWSSSNTNVATVSGGTVTALAVGTATITVTTVDGGKTATCAVTVNKKTGATVTAPTVSGSPTNSSISVNAVSLQTATGQSIEYAILTVNNGSPSTWQSSTSFTGLNSGTTYYVYARSKEDTDYYAGALSVSAGIATTVPVTNVTLNKDALILTIGNTEILTATVTPSNATNPAVTWSSSNTNVATVSGGTVTALAVGTATITVTTVDGGKTATCAVIVDKKTGAALSKPVITWNAALNRIDVAAVTAPANGQIVEYNISTANDGSGLGTWQTGLSFNIPATGTYYVYARSKENTEYYAGALSVSDGLGVVNQGINFVFAPDQSPEITKTGLIIYRSSGQGPAKATLTISNYAYYTSVTWYYNNTPTPLGSGATYELDSSNPIYNMIGFNFIRVEAWKNGVPYITNIEFEVR